MKIKFDNGVEYNTNEGAGIGQCNHLPVFKKRTDDVIRTFEVKHKDDWGVYTFHIAHFLDRGEIECFYYRYNTHDQIRMEEQMQKEEG